MPRESGFDGILIDPNELNFGQPRYSGTEYGHLKHQFFNNTVAALNRIAQSALGAELLELIGKRHQGIGTRSTGADRTVTILFRPAAVNQGASAGAMDMQGRFGVSRTFGGRPFRFAGAGSASKIRMHNGPDSEAIYTQLAGVPTPVWVALAHELIHALHHLSGTAYEEEVASPQGGARREEMWTTGLGAYANTRLSENAIRREAGLAERTHYTFPNDHALIGSLVASGPLARPGYWYCACLQARLGDL